MTGQPHMTDKAADVGPGIRRILAPLPLPPEVPDPDGEPLFYLSWPGWELYLARRLPSADRKTARPLMLPDLRSPEEDFAAVDQLVRAAGELGTGLLGLPGRTPESVPGLAGAIRGYHQGPEGEPGPVLDDRSYLALWAATEHQARENERLLAEAAAKERSMWAALKGEEGPPPEEVSASGRAPEEADRRTVYAWRCWRRLAGPWLLDSDVIVPNAPTAVEEAP